MDDPQRMQILDPNNNLLDDIGAFFLCQKLVLFYELEQIFSLDKFGDDVDMGFLLDAFFEEHEQWVWKYFVDAALMPVLVI